MTTMTAAQTERHIVKATQTTGAFDETTARRITLTWPRMVRSELVKFFTLRSSWIILAVTILVTAGMSAIVWASYRMVLTNPDVAAQVGAQGGDLGAMSASIFEFCGLFGGIVLIILGAMAVTNEYGSGMIRSTFTAAPRKIQAVLAKAFVIAVVAAVMAVLSYVLSWGLGWLMLHGTTIDTSFWGNDNSRYVYGVVLYLIGITLLGVCLGYIIRSGAGAIGAGVMVAFGLDLVFQVLTSLTHATPTAAGWRRLLYRVWEVTPAHAGSQLGSGSGDPNALLTGWQGMGVMGLWVIVLGVIACLLVRRRDL